MVIEERMVASYAGLIRGQIPRAHVHITAVDRGLLDPIDLREKRLLNVGCGLYHVSDEH